jgi:hypothetical protein
VERRDVPSQIRWECPACGEAGVIDGWQGLSDDLSAFSQSDEGGGAISVVVPEKAYQLLLDELVRDPECERVLYGARPHHDGVEPWGNEEDFEELMGAVAAEANHSPSRNRQRRFDDVYACLDAGSRSRLEQSTDVVEDELARFELFASRAHITELVRHELATVAKEHGITEQSAWRFLTEENLRELARQAAVKVADEQPGAELFDQPRTIPASLQTIGRSIAALAEAAQVRMLNADSVGVDGSLQILSLIGQLLHALPAAPPGPVFLPQAALTRSARLLEATAQMIREGAVMSSDIPADAVAALAEAFAQDASTLRALVGEHGTSTGPLPIS